MRTEFKFRKNKLIGKTLSNKVCNQLRAGFFIDLKPLCFLQDRKIKGLFVVAIDLGSYPLLKELKIGGFS